MAVSTLIGKTNDDNLPYLKSTTDEAFIDIITIVNKVASPLNPDNATWFGDPTANSGVGDGVLYNAFNHAVSAGATDHGTFYADIVSGGLKILLDSFGTAPAVSYTKSDGTFADSNDALVADLQANGGGDKAVAGFKDGENVPRLQIYLGDVVRLMIECVQDAGGTIILAKIVTNGELIYAKLKAIQLIGVFLASFSALPASPWTRIQMGGRRSRKRKSKRPSRKSNGKRRRSRRR